MGIFKRLKAKKETLKPMVDAGGNYNFIAQNIACIYYVVDNSYYCVDYDEDHKLFASALMATIAFVSDGSISINELEDAVRFSGTAVIRSGLISVNHGGINDLAHENNRLINMVMQLEALEFSCFSNMPVRAIINSVINNKQAIIEMIDKTIKEGSACPLYSKIVPFVDASFESEDFRNLVLSYGDFE